MTNGANLHMLEEQMKQQAAINSGKLTLQKSETKADIWLLALFLILIFPTFGLSIILLFIYLYRRMFSKFVYVKNIATYEKFFVSRQSWKNYKKQSKRSKKEVRKID